MARGPDLHLGQWNLGIHLDQYLTQSVEKTEQELSAAHAADVHLKKGMRYHLTLPTDV